MRADVWVTALVVSGVLLVTSISSSSLSFIERSKRNYQRRKTVSHLMRLLNELDSVKDKRSEEQGDGNNNPNNVEDWPTTPISNTITELCHDRPSQVQSNGLLDFSKYTSEAYFYCRKNCQTQPQVQCSCGTIHARDYQICAAAKMDGIPEGRERGIFKVIAVPPSQYLACSPHETNVNYVYHIFKASKADYKRLGIPVPTEESKFTGKHPVEGGQEEESSSSRRRSTSNQHDENHVTNVDCKARALDVPAIKFNQIGSKHLFVCAPSCVAAGLQYFGGCTCGMTFEGHSHICTAAYQSHVHAGVAFEVQVEDPMTYTQCWGMNKKQSNGYSAFTIRPRADVDASQVLDRANGNKFGGFGVKQKEPDVQLPRPDVGYIYSAYGLAEKCGKKIFGEGPSKRSLDVSAASAGLKLEPRIVGGSLARENEWPWLVFIEGIQTCGGTLIHPEFVLTAAHCLVDAATDKKPNTDPDNYLVTIGQHAIREANVHQVDRYVIGVYPHANYIHGEAQADIALLKLNAPVVLSKYHNIGCLPSKTDMFKPGKKCWIAGWGDLAETNIKFHGLLYHTELSIFDFDNCSAQYEHEISRDMHICTYGEGKDSCVGDSGGPVMCLMHDQYLVAGLVSYGQGCGRKGVPGVNTRVAYYTDWIKEIVNREQTPVEALLEFESSSQSTGHSDD